MHRADEITQKWQCLSCQSEAADVALGVGRQGHAGMGGAGRERAGARQVL